MIFDTEYVSELEWTMVEPRSKTNEIDVKFGTPLCKPAGNYGSNRDRGDVSDVQSILHLIRLIEQMIQYNNIYYEIIEDRRRRQNIELQVLTTFLQNICNDLKTV